MTKFDKWFNRLALDHPYAVSSAAVLIEGGALFAMLPAELRYIIWLPAIFTWLILVWVFSIAKRNNDDPDNRKHRQAV